MKIGYFTMASMILLLAALALAASCGGDDDDDDDSSGGYGTDDDAADDDVADDDVADDDATDDDAVDDDTADDDTADDDAADDDTADDDAADDDTGGDIVDAVYQGMTASPDPVNITVGQTVRWTNLDILPHTVTSGNPGDADAGALFDSPSLSKNDTFEFTFTVAGTFNYFCYPHQGSMFGYQVIVTQ